MTTSKVTKDGEAQLYGLVNEAHENGWGSYEGCGKEYGIRGAPFNYAARFHAKDMYNRDYESHDIPEITIEGDDGNLYEVDGWEDLKLPYGYQDVGTDQGENIAWGNYFGDYSDVPATVFDGWIAFHQPQAPHPGNLQLQHHRGRDVQGSELQLVVVRHHRRTPELRGGQRKRSPRTLVLGHVVQLRFHGGRRPGHLRVPYRAG